MKPRISIVSAIGTLFLIAAPLLASAEKIIEAIDNENFATAEEFLTQDKSLILPALRLAADNKKIVALEFLMNSVAGQSVTGIKWTLFFRNYILRSNDFRTIKSLIKFIGDARAIKHQDFSALFKIVLEEDDLESVIDVVKKDTEPDFLQSPLRLRAIVYLLERGQDQLAEDFLNKGLTSSTNAPDADLVFKWLLYSAIDNSSPIAFAKLFALIEKMSISMDLSALDWTYFLLVAIEKNNYATFKAILRQLTKAGIEKLGDPESNLFDSLITKKPEWIPRALDAGFDPNAITFMGKPLTVILGFWNRPDVVARILDKYGKKLEVLQKDSKTNAIQFLMSTLKWDAAALFIKAGANTNIVDSSAHPPLYIAIQYNKYDIVDLLLERDVDINAPSKFGETPLMALAMQGKLDHVAKLVNLGAVVDAQTPETKMTALSYAAAHGHTEIMKLLIDAHADPNTRDHEDSTLLHHAAKSGKAEAIKYLLARNFDKHSLNKNGETPLSIAVRHEQLEAIEIFLEDKQKEDYLYVWKLAGRYDRTSVADFLSNPIYFSSDNNLTLGKKGAWFDAAVFGKNAILKWLLDNGISIDDADDSGNTALMLAAKHKNSQTVKMLLEAGAHADLANADGKTATDLTDDEEIKQILKSSK